MNSNAGKSSRTVAHHAPHIMVVLAVAVLAFTGIALTGCSDDTGQQPDTPAEPQQGDQTVAKGDAQTSDAQKTVRPEATVKLVQLGKDLYGKNCAICHGDTGKGDGKAAFLQSPKPRDFTEGKFNRKNSPPRNLPFDEDLFKAISEGLPGSSMPPWKDYVSEEETWALVEYMKKELIALVYEDTGEVVSLYEMEPPEDALPVPEEIPVTAENIAIGKALYLSEAECWTCHGRTGHGDGPEAEKMINPKGERVYPIDLAKGIYKLSTNNEELFRRIRDGITLAPMYSMGEKLSDEQVWCLVHFVRSLINRTEEQRKMSTQYRRTIEVSKLEGGVPGGPNDERWQEIPPSYIPLMSLWWRENPVEGVFVRAVHDGSRIAVHLSWADAVLNGQSIRVEEFSDGAALQFSLTDNPPFMGMGDKDGSVNIWYWKADHPAPDQPLAGIETAFPHMMVNYYPFQKVPGAGRLSGGPIEDQNPVYVPGWGSGNPVSDPRARSPVENLHAGGLGTLTEAGGVRSRVAGEGAWQSGRWQLVLSRKLDSDDPRDVVLEAGQTVSVGFAVWDGAAGDRNGQKQFSIWHKLTLQ